MSDQPKMLLIRVEADIFALDGEPVSSIVTWAQNILDQVPVEYREKVKLEYDSADEHTSGGLHFSYNRLETEPERHERERAAEEYRAKEVARQNAAERAQYERLKAKFEPLG